MKSQLATLILLFFMVGCSSFKAATGEYVTEAVRDDIAKRIEVILEKRGLSIDEIKQATDSNNDNNITRHEVYGTIKDMTRDYVMLEAKNYIDGKLETINTSVATKGDVESASDKLWQWLLGLISIYLTKQLYSQKGDHKRDQRLALLEKIVHKDLDGDGTIGAPQKLETDPKTTT